MSRKKACYTASYLIDQGKKDLIPKSKKIRVFESFTKDAFGKNFLDVYLDTCNHKEFERLKRKLDDLY